MPPRRTLATLHTLTTTPPPTLPPTQTLTRLLSSPGNNLHSVLAPSGRTLLVELPQRFRGKLWLRRGGYVLVDTEGFGGGGGGGGGDEGGAGAGGAGAGAAAAGRGGRIEGEIVNVVREEKRWRGMAYWPVEFGKQSGEQSDSGDSGGEESVVGKMPPRSESDEE